MESYITPVVVPYTGGIPGGLKQGLEIEIVGTVPHYSGSGFSVNLCQGPQMEPNTLMHFNVRFNENCVVINSLQNNGWGGEERKGLQHLKKGATFDLRILVKPHMYKIKLNGQQFADFGHRLPKEMGQFLLIKGEVSVNYIRYHSDRPAHHHFGTAADFAPPASYPSYPHTEMAYPAPAGFAPPYGGAGFVPPSYPMGAAPPPSQPIYNPPVPFKSGIPGGLAPGRMISISGAPLPNASRFTVNLQNGFNDGSDIMLHFDVRIRFGDSVNTVVRNHCQRGGWGQEERQVSYFPFMPNANFDLLILTEAHAFKVAVNNQHLVEFRHRLPYQEATALVVTGDVRLTQVRFQ